MLAGWAIALALLGLLGLGVENKLRATSLDIPGTESSRASQLQRAHFGNSAPFAILLQGPAAQLDIQGPDLVRALRAEEGVTTLSPWDRGSGLARLRSAPTKALILVDFHTALDEAVKSTVPRLQRSLDETISPPVEAHSSGFASISRALQDESIAATERGEMIAVPILMVVLLLVFRSPVAASIPLLFGGATLVASRGVLDLLASWLAVDSLALSVGSMMGLALGVDYALLMVARFREELAGGTAPAEAAYATKATAGRTIVLAGSTVAFAMLVSALVLPGSLLVSLAGSVVIATLLSVVVALTAGPALLAVLGPNVNRWRIGRPRTGSPRWIGPVRYALKRPGLAAALISLSLLALAAPALALETGPPDVSQLPASDPARRDYERLQSAAGPGWGAPFVVVAASKTGTMADPARLQSLANWQSEIASDPGIEMVIGPGPLAERTRPLHRLGRELVGSRQRLDQGRRSLGHLHSGLDRATAGVEQLRSGLARAGDGAVALANGSEQTQSGVTALSQGLASARAGSEQAASGLAAIRSGAEDLAAGARREADGAERLSSGLTEARRPLADQALPGAKRLAQGLGGGSTGLDRLRQPAQLANDQLALAWQRLQQMTVGRADPRYAQAADAVGRAWAAVSGRNPLTGQPVSPGYAGLPTELARARDQLARSADGAAALALGAERLKQALSQLQGGADRLGRGADSIADGSDKLAAGADRLASEAPTLSAGLGRLSAGAERLAAGTARLQNGANQLEQGLAGGYERSAPLASGLERAGAGVATFQSRLASSQRGLDRLEQTSPGLFDSGYFVLSALDGTPPDRHEQVGQTVDLAHGGQATQMLVIPKVRLDTQAANALKTRLEGNATRLGQDTGARTGVTGGAAQLSDYDQVASSRLPLVILAAALATYLLLVAFLRALLLPALAVLLNLATVAAAFGVLTFLFELLPGHPLGGAGYMDTVGTTGIFGIVFGLSIDYAVFLLSRMRERYLETGNTNSAIEYGLERTAGVITGAAAIMAGVFAAFATSSIATISEFGIGLTVAVLLDATVVRLVLLPALMRLLGDRVWWLPRWLERLMPRFDALLAGSESASPRRRASISPAPPG